MLQVKIPTSFLNFPWLLAPIIHELEPGDKENRECTKVKKFFNLNQEP